MLVSGHAPDIVKLGYRHDNMRNTLGVMYHLKQGIKRNPERRWALPDRVFFGYGACAILAGVYLKYPPLSGFYAERLMPGEGYFGNHIFVTNGDIAFDYHGYSKRVRLLRHHTCAWSDHSSDGWHCTLERVEFNLLDSAALNTRKMLGPDQYLGDPIARAMLFIGRVDHGAGSEKAARLRVSD